MNEVELLHLMMDATSMQPADLAARLGVSTRTVRTYIQRINTMLADAAAIEYHRSAGYTFVIHDQAAFDDATRKIRERISPALNTSSRTQYLLVDLLSRIDWVTLDDLSHVLFVSRATISNELKQVEDVLASFALCLERRSHRGIRVVGPEMQRRLCLANITMYNALGDESEPEVRKRLEAISRIIEEVSSSSDLQINSVAYQNLLVHISIALMRIDEGCYVPIPAEQLDSIREGSSYRLAQHVADRINDELSVELPEEEIAYIAIHLAGKRVLPDAMGTVPDSPTAALADSEISDEVWDVVSDMLDAVWGIYHFDLRGDLELRMSLASHIAPLSVRLKYGMGMENPLLEDIKIKYALAYSMAVDSAPMLMGAFGGELSEAEIGYIALAYALALERARVKPQKKNVLVVCASGRGSARLLEYRIKQMFSDYLDHVETCDAGHVANRDFTNIDYVFTTVPLDLRKVPVPVCRMPFFFDESDAEQITTFLMENVSDASLALQFFYPTLFRPHMEAVARDEVLRTLCADLRRVHMVPDEYESLVFQREEFMATAFGGLIALPHAIRACSERTVVNVALLDAPIDWGGKQVQIVFLISFSRDPEPELERFYQCIAQFIANHAAVRELLDSRSYSTLMKLLGAIEQRLLSKD